MIQVELGQSTEQLKRDFDNYKKTLLVRTAALAEAETWEERSTLLYQIRQLSEAMELISDELGYR